ncbi:organic cation transporter protein-like [Ylistrum balloti]|uniref:organic cation transporter protein-like n=1 Tax=Ylistrum balloti TaxID=509963 RepID=UPI0029058F0B|nr:organic cation transporter protein-like [Ylistrum balloti]
MAFMGGNLFGSFILGFIGDTWGRKIVMYIGAVLLFGSSLGCAWANSFIFFVVLRFIAGAATTSGIGSLMIIMFETVDPAHRSHATVAVEVSWCLGEIILSGAAYFIRDWRSLQIAISCPGGILLLYWLFVPESARWLLSKGKGVKAMKIVQRAAYMNKRQPHIDAKEVKLEQRKSWNELLPLFQSCRLFVRFMVIAMLWFILSLSYYGLTFNVGRIGNNAYLEFIIYAVLEMVAYVSCLFINTRLGRKPLNIGAFLLAGVACISSTLISRYADGDNDWLIIVLSAIGRMGVSATFANAFVYTGELFPTTIRSFILACTNVATRTGAIISPYLTESGTNKGGGLGYTSLIFGVLTLAAGIVSCFLPETLNTSLPDNIDDMDGRRKQQFAQKNDDTLIATVL